MKTKFLKTIPLLLVIGLTACGGSGENYIKCDKVQIHGGGSYEKMEPQNIRVAQYESSISMEGCVTTGYGAEKKTIYTAVSASNTNEFAASVTFHYICPQGYENTCTAHLISEIGTFTSYHEVYYSPNTRTIKYIEATNQEVTIKDKTNYSTLIDSYKYLYSYTKVDGQQSIVATGYGYSGFTQSTKTTFTDLGSTAVTYNTYTEPSK